MVQLHSNSPLQNSLAFAALHGLLLLPNALGVGLAVLHLSPGGEGIDAVLQFDVTRPILSLEAHETDRDSIMVRLARTMRSALAFRHDRSKQADVGLA